MSPNRYWCYGAELIFNTFFLAESSLYVCHSLQNVRSLMLLSTNIVLIIEEYGDGENIIDFLEFTRWVENSIANLRVVYVTHPETILCRTNLVPGEKEQIPVNASNSELLSLFLKIRRNQLKRYNVRLGEIKMTKRELRVLQLLCYGEPVAMVGAKLEMSVKTVFLIKYKALDKLGLKRISSLVGRYKGIISHLEGLKLRDF
jgi:DNA-binding CsgD family transcriptional regulator